MFRTAVLRSGEWIYTNGLHQALGANSDLLHRTDYYRAFYPAPGDPTHDTRDLYNALTYDFFGSHRAAHNGDLQLPTDAKRWPEGTADLAEVRLAIAGDSLYVRFLWNSFPRADAQIATLTFTTAGAPASAPAGLAALDRPWPRHARLSSPWQAALTLWGTGAAVTGVQGRETAVTARVGDHVTEARIPLSLLPRGPWSLRGGAGLQDPASAGRYWDVPTGNATATAPGSGAALSPTNVWDLLFADDRPWTFDELHQADELFSGDASAATVTVDPAALAAGRSDGAAAARTGDISRMFASRLSAGDGILDESGVGADTSPPAGFQPPIPNSGFDRTYLYRGRLQPYGMHIPDRYPASRGRWPLIVYLHGFTGLPDEAFYNPVGLVQEADRRGYLVATPLGRGDYFYRGPGDLDVLEVIRDVERHYRVDPDRIYLMGHSMGGYGTNNVATHHPDLFAAVAPAEGTDSIALHRNLRDLPWFEMSAIEDLDTGATQAKQLYGDLSADGYDARLLVYTTKIHEYSSIYDTLPDLFSFFGSHRRQANPSAVTWTVPVGQDQPKLGLIYDGAYWLDDVRARKGTVAPTLTVTTDGIRHASAGPARRTDEQVDTMGPTGRSKGELFTTTPSRGRAVRVADHLAIVATGVVSASVDARRARVGFSRRVLRIGIRSDARFTLHLRRLPAALGSLRLDRRRVRAVRTVRGMLVVSVPRGRHTLLIAPRRPRTLRQHPRR